MADRPQIELDAPAETAEGGAAAPKGGGFKSFLPLIITVILMPAIAWAMTTFVLVPKLQKSLGAAPAPSEHATEGGGEHENAATEKEHGLKSGGSKETVTMTKLLVNVSGTMGSRYLLASLTISGGSSDFKAKVEKNEAKLRDMACTVLATKTINDLEKPGARNLVRSELLTGFNNILGANTVQEIYITEFAIQ
jgi:flagellar FliL protein